MREKGDFCEGKVVKWLKFLVLEVIVCVRVLVVFVRSCEFWGNYFLCFILFMCKIGINYRSKYVVFLCCEI